MSHSGDGFQGLVEVPRNTILVGDAREQLARLPACCIDSVVTSPPYFGLRPGCDCGADWQPGVVLDPFLGSGTVAVVAEALGRDWLGIELNPSFVTLAEARLACRRDQRNRAA